jgi:hypothetical protein
MIAFAQFKAGTFSLGPSLNINYYKSGSNYNNFINLGINASIFISKKSAIGVGIGKNTSDYNYALFNSEFNSYNLNYQFYSTPKHLFGFLNQTDLNITNSQDYSSSINSIQVVNNIGIYSRLYKGLIIKIRYGLVSYAYSNNTFKNSDYENKSNTFSLNLNPFVNLSSLQLDFAYYFNLKKDEK